MPGAGRPHGPPAKKMQAAGTTGSAETSRHSPRDGLHAYIVISPVYGSLATVAPGIIARKLGASVAAPGPHDFTSASCRSSACKHAAAGKRPSPPRLTCRDDRDTPLVAKQDGRSRAHFLVKRKPFLLGGQSLLHTASCEQRHTAATSHPAKDIATICKIGSLQRFLKSTSCRHRSWPAPPQSTK